ncbi:MAG: carboxylesterase family protein [Lawsonella sp.]
MDTFTHSPIVPLRDGDVQGVEREHDCRFFGIPYAAPLVKENRFAGPQPVKPWLNVLDCTEPAATCQRFQIDPNPAIPDPVIDGDNQLHVTVYAPTDALTTKDKPISDKKLPVFVWLHGGGFISGSNAIDWWDGKAFTAKDVVVVVPNYRLGAEGWMPLNDTESYNNRGLFDQIAALKWVRDNISAFGGDPDNVTIGGQSAGGTSVLSLMTAPAAEGLFHRVFACSPAIIRLPTNAKGKNMVRLGKTIFPFRDFNEWDMREWPKKDMYKLEKGMHKLHPFGMPYHPTIDAETNPEPLKLAAKKPDFRKIPLLIGSTSEEFNSIVFNGPLSLVTRAAVEVALRAAGVNKRERSSVIGTHANDIKRGRVGAVMTDTMIRSGVTYVVEGRERTGKVNSPSQTWLYDYRWAGRQGAGHCTDLPLWWGNLDAENATEFTGPVTDGKLKDPKGQFLAEQMNRALIRFIKDGDPGWPAFTDRTRACMLLDEKIELDYDTYSKERKTWMVDPFTRK